jgi:hypothetical protein
VTPSQEARLLRARAATLRAGVPQAASNCECSHTRINHFMLYACELCGCNKYRSELTDEHEAMLREADECWLVAEELVRVPGPDDGDHDI